MEKLERQRVRILVWRDAAYPALLLEIEDPPPALYTYGKLTEADGNFPARNRSVR